MENFSLESQKSKTQEEHIQKIESDKQLRFTEQQLASMTANLESQSIQEANKVLERKESVLDQGLNSLHVGNDVEIQKTSVSIKDKFTKKISALKNSFVSSLKMIGIGAMLTGSTSMEGIAQNTQDSVQENSHAYDIPLNSTESPVLTDTYTEEYKNDLDRSDKLMDGDLVHGDGEYESSRSDEYTKKLYEFSRMHYDEGINWVRNKIDNPVYQKRIKENLQTSGLFGTEHFVSVETEKKLGEGYSLTNPETSDITGTNRYLSERALEKEIREQIVKESGAEDGVHEYEQIRKYYGDSGVDIQITPLQTPGVLVHEITHAVTDANFLLPPSTQKAYSHAFKGVNFDEVKFAYEWAVTRDGIYVGASGVPKWDMLSENEKSIMVSNQNEYLSNPTEIDARKAELEYHLERLGVWKYGESFTEKTYHDALLLSNEKKTSFNSYLLLHMMDKEKLIEIMNTIA